VSVPSDLPAVFLAGLLLPVIVAVPDPRADPEPAFAGPPRRLPFVVFISESIVVMMVLFGMIMVLFAVLPVVGGSAALGFGEMGVGLVVSIPLVVWAARHPGYRWWRWQ
jgi:hypothetical protein